MSAGKIRRTPRDKPPTSIGQGAATAPRARSGDVILATRLAEQGSMARPTRPRSGLQHRGRRPPWIPSHSRSASRPTGSGTTSPGPGASTSRSSHTSPAAPRDAALRLLQPLARGPLLAPPCAGSARHSPVDLAGSPKPGPDRARITAGHAPASRGRLHAREKGKTAPPPPSLDVPGFGGTLPAAAMRGREGGGG